MVTLMAILQLSRVGFELCPLRLQSLAKASNLISVKKKIKLRKIRDLMHSNMVLCYNLLSHFNHFDDNDLQCHIEIIN
jgi:hypothetical protein